MIDAKEKKSLKPFIKILFNKDYLTTLSIRALVVLLTLITSIITTRCLGPEGRGEYFFVITFANIVAQFANLGLHSSNTYYIVQKNTLAPSLVINSVWISIIVGSFTSLLGISLWILFQHPSKTQLLDLSICIALAPMIVFYLLGSNLFLGLNLIRTYNIYQIASSMSIAFLIVLMGALGANATHFLLAVTLGWFIICTAIFLSLIKKVKITSFKFNATTFLSGLHYSFKSYIVSFLNILVLKLNVVFLKYFVPAAVVGYYSVAAQLNDILVIAPITLCMLLFPKMIANENNRWEQMKSNLLITAVFMGIICTATWLLAPTAIILIFGQNFSPTVKILLYMLPAAFFYSLLSVILTYVSSLGIPKMQIINWLIGLIIYLILNAYLIPSHGAIGAAIALSATYFILFVIMYALAIKCAERRKITVTTISHNE